MIVLAVLSVVCFYIFFERLAVIRRAGKDDPLFMERIRDYIRTGEIKSALNYCRITNTPAAHMIEKGISRMKYPVRCRISASISGESFSRTLPERQIFIVSAHI